MSDKNVQRLVLVAFCLSGAAALIYEVVWTRALSFVLGSTVYSLSILLATFMAGLALGAYIGGKIADRKGDLLLYFGLFEIGIGCFGIVTVPLIYRLPSLYFWMFKTFHLKTGVYFTVQFLLCIGIMLIPTTLMGATFPVVSKRITRTMEEMGRKVGDAYSANTFGAIAGSLIAGFVLVPLMGIKWASFTAGIVNVTIGLSILMISRFQAKRAVSVISLIVLMVGGMVVYSAELRYPSTTFYQAGRHPDLEALRAYEERSEILVDKDYAQGHIIAYREGEFISIQQGGKIEGTALSDIPNTVMLSTIPLAAFPDTSRDILVIGLGAGVTVWAANKLSDSVDVVEINPGVVDVVESYGLAGTLDGVTVHINDARRFLLYADRTFDIITSEPSLPSDSMESNLFTREFYEIASSRLGKGGVFCQWLPAWILTKRDARAAFKTFASVFEYSALWLVEASEDFIMIGSGEPFRYTLPVIRDRAMDHARTVMPEQWTAEMERQDNGFEKRFGIRLIRNEERMRDVLAMDDIPVITDDRPLIEFAVTRNILLYPDHKGKE
jgi:spermidine synthase